MKNKKIEIPKCFQDDEEVMKRIAVSELRKLQYKISEGYICFLLLLIVSMIAFLLLLTYHVKIFEEYGQAEVYTDEPDGDGNWIKTYYVDGIEYSIKVTPFDIIFESKPKYVDYKIGDPNVAMIDRTEAIIVLMSCEGFIVLLMIGSTTYEIVRRKKSKKVYKEEREKFFEMYGEEDKWNPIEIKRRRRR